MWGAPWQWGPGNPTETLAIFGAVFLPIIAIVIIVWLVIRGKMKRRHWEHEERMAMVNRGIMPEEITVEAELATEKTSAADKMLLTGIILAALGLMWIFNSFGGFLVLLGAGLMVMYLIPQLRQSSRKRGRKFFITGVIIAAAGVGFWVESFGWFLLILGAGLLGLYYLSHREKAVLQPQESDSEPRMVEEEQPEQEGEVAEPES